MEKILLIICDGLSDRPIKQLGYKTPLEAAFKPNLDKLAYRGMIGLMNTVDIGVRPGSDVAHLSIFGYDINKYYSGRGPFEASGYGVKVKSGDIAFRGNFATVDNKMKIIDRRAGRIEETKPLILAINKIKINDIQILVQQGVGHRVAIVFRGKNLDCKISDTDPHLEGKTLLNSVAASGNSDAERTAMLVNEFTQKIYKILNNHPLNLGRIKRNLPPANIILLRGAGKLLKIPSFYQKYHLRSACIAGAGLYKGIANIVGMKIINVAGATGKPDTDIVAKIKAALKSFSKYDFVFLHIKGTDVLAEDGDYIGKKKFIEKIDRALKLIVPRDDILIVVTADHTTSSRLKIHTADPVPVLIAGDEIRSDFIKTFDEKNAYLGGLGRITGNHLMPILIDLLGRAPLKGA
jgi:2,3-bisphosphoglycerate-independent phosphoglycerate mutase